MKSKNEKVQKFLDEIAGFDREKFAILQKLRAAVFAKIPVATEKIKYGGICFFAAKFFGGIFVHKNHISFEFCDGATFSDPEKILAGAGKFRRHLKFFSLADIAEKKFDFFLAQI